MIYLGLALRFWRELLVAFLFVILCVLTALYVERGQRIDTLRVTHSAELDRLETLALTVHSNNQERVINAINQSNRQADIIEQHAISASAANDSLRDTITQLRGQVATVSDSARIEYAHSLADVLGECTAEYIKMAKSADGHARDSEMIYRAWPKN